MTCHFTDDSSQDEINEEEEEVEEHFPTAPLDDDVWMEEPVPNRHLYIHEQSQPHGLHPSLAHTAWISYIPPQNTHQHHNTCTSVTSSIFEM